MRWRGGRKERALGRKEKTDGAKKNCRFVKDSIISLSIHDRQADNKYSGPAQHSMSKAHSKQEAKGVSSASGL